MVERVSINWFGCLLIVRLYRNRKKMFGNQTKPKHEWAQINEIQSQHRHTKRNRRRCVFVTLFTIWCVLYIYSIWQSMLFYAPLSIANAGSVLTRRRAPSFGRILCYVIRDDCKTSRRFLFSTTFFSSFIFAFLMLIIILSGYFMLYYCFFGFICVSLSLFAISIHFITL